MSTLIAKSCSVRVRLNSEEQLSSEENFDWNRHLNGWICAQLVLLLMMKSWRPCGLATTRWWSLISHLTFVHSFLLLMKHSSLACPLCRVLFAGSEDCHGVATVEDGAHRRLPRQEASTRCCLKSWSSRLSLCRLSSSYPVMDDPLNSSSSCRGIQENPSPS
jgi:hypothetical protein